MLAYPKCSFPIAVASLLFCYAQSLVKLPENVTIPAVFMFGDSIVDTGNNNGLITICKSNFPPYGRDFKGGQPTGRFSNGMVPSDFIVRYLGIKHYLPAYLDPALQDKDLPTGVCFASSGVGFDPLTPQIMGVKSLPDQLKMFKEYKARLQKMVGNDRADFIVTNSLYILAAGTNDILNTYNHLSFRSWEYNLNAYTDIMVASAYKFLKNLHSLGARRIGAFGIPAVGCAPLQRTLYGGLERVCADNGNEAAQLFNSKIQKVIKRFNRDLPKVKMGYMDGYNTLMEVIQNKEKYGFEFADFGCCGTGLYEVSFACNEFDDVFSCPNVSEYIFWDSYHPTEKFYKISIQMLLPKLINTLFATANTSANSTRF